MDDFCKLFYFQLYNFNFRDAKSEADHLRREGGVQLGREDQPDVHLLEQPSAGKPLMVHQRRTGKGFLHK